MQKKKMWVEYEDGSDLSKSRKKPGQYSPLTREDGTNRLGHVTLSDVDEDEGEGSSVTYTQPVYDSYEPVYDSHENASRPPPLTAEEHEELVRLLADLITVGAILTVRAAPHVKRLWNDKAAPALRSARDKTASGLAEVRRRARQGVRISIRRSDSDELATFVESVSADSPEGVTTALEAYLPSMSSAEAQQRLAAALIAMAVSERAKAVSDEQLGILLHARIEGADCAPAGQGSLENLTPEGVERRVHQMLTASPTLLDELTALLARGQGGAAEPQPPLPRAAEAGRRAARRRSRSR
jgi:hypothetical protein